MTLRGVGRAAPALGYRLWDTGTPTPRRVRLGYGLRCGELMLLGPELPDLVPPPFKSLGIFFFFSQLPFPFLPQFPYQKEET